MYKTAVWTNLLTELLSEIPVQIQTKCGDQRSSAFKTEHCVSKPSKRVRRTRGQHTSGTNVREHVDRGQTRVRHVHSQHKCSQLLGK